MAEARKRVTYTESSSSDDTCDEIREEEIQEECQDRKRQRKDKTDAFCDVCFMQNLIDFRKCLAFYLCYLCEQYMCEKCFEIHKSRKHIKWVSEKAESYNKIESYLDEIIYESESEREERFEREEVAIIDKVHVKHKLDQKDCANTGLCGLNNAMWVVCDGNNMCIKIFSVGSNNLLRYIRFKSLKPYGVTEINIKRGRNMQDVKSANDISVTNQGEPGNTFLLAVTLPRARKIVFIDVKQTPAIITDSMNTDKSCYSIDFSEDTIFTLCRDDLGTGPWCLSLISTEGVTIKTFNTDLSNFNNHLYLAVCRGKSFITDYNYNKVFCMTDKGKEVFHKIIEGLRPEGISVDSDTNQVYICAGLESKLYRLDFSLENKKLLFNLNAVNCLFPRALCLYRDRLYVSHGLVSTNENYVSVVRVL